MADRAHQLARVRRAVAGRACATCDAVRDCRPYGAGGAWICRPCMDAMPHDEQLAAFSAAFDAAASRRRVNECVAIGADLDGPTLITIPDGPGKN